jgi:uncharacterized protein YcbX
MKSLDGVRLDRVTVTAAGALAGDREFALFDQQGKVWNAKRSPALQRIRAAFTWAERTVVLGHEEHGDRSAPLHLDRDGAAIAAWIGQQLGKTLTLKRDPMGGFPDDRRAWGPTIISTATLETVAGWLAATDAPLTDAPLTDAPLTDAPLTDAPPISVDELRDRLRTNLEIDGVPPFWEDRLYGTQPVPFQIGSVPFLGINPCQRCPVPTRHPRTAAVHPQFQARVTAQRQATLPDWAERSKFKGYYRLAVNTQILRQQFAPEVAPEVAQTAVQGAGQNARAWELAGGDRTLQVGDILAL